MTAVTAPAVAADVYALLADYDAGRWTPNPWERALAEDLAHTRLTPHEIRAALQHALAPVICGQFATALTHASFLPESGTGSLERSVYMALRRLLDALAHSDRPTAAAGPEPDTPRPDSGRVAPW